MRHCFKAATFVVLPILAALSLSTLEVRGEPQMTPNVVEQKEFIVIGIAARTTNGKEATAEGVIGKLWGRFFAEGILEKIPSKANGNILAVYTDYESDKNGAYTFVLGAKVNSDANVPTGMVAKKVPSGRYAMFTTEKGPLEQVVPKEWMKIWSVPKSEPGGDREYKGDFEIYDQRAADPQNGQADIYVRMK